MDSDSLQAKPRFLRTYDENGNMTERDTKGEKGGMCGMAACTMPNAYWLMHGRYVCHWCAQDANRLWEGIAVKDGA